jgi:hypothetical protein
MLAFSLFSSCLEVSCLIEDSFNLFFGLSTETRLLFSSFSDKFCVVASIFSFLF